MALASEMDTVVLRGVFFGDPDVHLGNMISQTSGEETERLALLDRGRTKGDGVVSFATTAATPAVARRTRRSGSAARWVRSDALSCACTGGGDGVPLGAISLTENLMMMAMAIWMMLQKAGVVTL